MSKKLTLEKVRQYIENFGYRLISTEYINNHTNILVQCNKQHIYSVRFNNFISGKRCPHCCGGIKFTLEQVRAKLESCSYTLLSVGYTNSHTDLEIKCPNNHIINMSYNAFSRGCRCIICEDRQKIDYEYVKNYIELTGYLLKSHSYTNAHNKLHTLCPKGHDYFVDFNHFKLGTRCPICRRCKKHTIEYAREVLLKYNYLLLSTQYTNNRTLLSVVCPSGHNIKISIGSFLAGHRCGTCFGKQKHPIEYVKKYIVERNYELLSTEYINGIKKLKIKCNYGHEYWASFSAFKHGNTRCPYCANNVPRTIDQVKELYRAEGYELLSNEYRNHNTKLNIKCPSGHQYTSSLGSWIGSNKGRCPVCANVVKYSWNFVSDYIKNYNNQLVSEYNGSNKKISILCEKKHLYRTTFNKFKHGGRCPHCRNFIQEEICRSVFEKITNKPFPTKKPYWLINPETGKKLELDGYCEELKLAFEYDGEFHFKKHFRIKNKNDSLEKQQNRDQLKNKLCLEKGVHLIRIPYTIKNKEQFIKEQLYKFCLGIS
ncbi:MAG TPA: hypothetical protein VI911_11450 [Patescibacteria group bacterium]|nr:hypothetical protein [Patescibacteria group bacterium]